MWAPRGEPWLRTYLPTQRSSGAPLLVEQITWNSVVELLPVLLGTTITTGIFGGIRASRQVRVDHSAWV
jgi:hypothetical protein